MTKERGPLIILSGPSGVGKSTVVRGLIETCSRPLRLSVSATTRPRRGAEEDGKDYYFWTREHFEQALRDGAFLEHAEVHGNYYGTLRSEVEPYRGQGIGVILDIDVQGAEQVRRLCPDAVTVFLRARSPAVLEARLRGRKTESEAAIQRRLAAAAAEEARSGEYQHVLINDGLDETVVALRELVEGHFERGSHAG